MIHLYIVIGCVIVMVILVLFFIDYRTLWEQNEEIQQKLRDRETKKWFK